jgi:tRNA 5-methylaminomethyl-2-thiouridine biosynthesis bifunctional protein
MDDAWLSGVGVPAVWAGRSRFTLLDTDFDQGLKFLLLWDAWRQDPCRSARLHVVGLLPYLPVQPASHIPERLQDLAQQLIAAWPLNLPGLHRLEFEGGAVTLTLGVGSAPVILSRLCARIDAFLLCEAGLEAAESQAPCGDMAVLAQSVCALASEQARVVMQGLSSVWLAPLVRLGVLEQDVESVTLPGSEPSLVCASLCVRRPWADDPWRQTPTLPQARHALVVGAGFAGMGVAHSLALRGWRVTVLDAQWGAEQSTHRQHAAAALTPMLARDDNIRGRLSRAGSLRAQHRWGHLPDSVLWRCGALQLQREHGRIVDLAAVVDALQFPEQWTQYVSAHEASDIAGLRLNRGGIHFASRPRPCSTPLPARQGSRSCVLRSRRSGATVKTGRRLAWTDRC